MRPRFAGIRKKRQAKRMKEGEEKGNARPSPGRLRGVVVGAVQGFQKSPWHLLEVPDKKCLGISLKFRNLLSS
jgi:hypothetical protein